MSGGPSPPHFSIKNKSAPEKIPTILQIATAH
jgi:hypothetical protein